MLHSSQKTKQNMTSNRLQFLSRNVWCKTILLFLFIFLGEGAQAGNNIGINIAEPVYYDISYGMADLVRSSTFYNFSDWGYLTNHDSLGQPTSDFKMIVNASHLPLGTYNIKFSGQVSKISTNLGTVSGLVYNPANNVTTGIWVVTADPNGINVTLGFSGTKRNANSVIGSGLTGIHIYKPGYPTDDSVLFTKEYLTAMKSVQVIRGMSFFDTNTNDSVDWTDRTLMAHEGTTASPANTDPLKPIYYRGQPYELMVTLANATGNDVWLNIPAKATDAYVLNLANLLKYGSDGVNAYTSPQLHPVYPPLNPSSKVYLEYCNEVWNNAFNFYCYRFINPIAIAAASDPSSPINFDGKGSTNTLFALGRYAAWRSSQISLMFRSVFGDAAMMNTIRPVLASWGANNYMTEQLRWAEGFYGSVRSYPYNPIVRSVSDIWYGAGAATYYTSSTDAGSTSASAMSAYFSDVPWLVAGKILLSDELATESTITHGYGIKFVSYEGGPSPGASNPSGLSRTQLNNLTIAYNIDPRMTNWMQSAYDNWTAAGGDLLNYFIYGGDFLGGAWNFSDPTKTTGLSDTTSPKMLALTAIKNRAPAPLTLGTSLPAVIPMNQSTQLQFLSFGSSKNTSFKSNGAKLIANPSAPAYSDALLIPVRVTSASSMKVKLATNMTSGAQVEIAVNGQPSGILNLANNNTYSSVSSTAAYVTLPAGLSVIRVRPLYGSVSVASVTVSQ